MNKDLPPLVILLVITIFAAATYFAFTSPVVAGYFSNLPLTTLAIFGMVGGLVVTGLVMFAGKKAIGKRSLKANEIIFHEPDNSSIATIRELLSRFSITENKISMAIGQLNEDYQAHLAEADAPYDFDYMLIYTDTRLDLYCRLINKNSNPPSGKIIYPILKVKKALFTNKIRIYKD